MHFLPDVYVTCDVCKGKRYNRETLEVLFKGKSIADVLDMTVEEALEFFKAVPRGARRARRCCAASASTTSMSASRRRRCRAARRSASSSPRNCRKRATGRTLYILDEPTTGLHFHDVAKLLEVLHELVESGNTVVVIEHNLEVIKTADWIIDLGPEGGDGGGEIVAAGTPEEIVREKRSYTGAFLKPVLARGGRKPRRSASRRRNNTTRRSMSYEQYKLCDDLKPKEYCVVVEQYKCGSFERKFHEHVPKHRLSEEALSYLLPALVMKFEEVMPAAILRGYAQRP